MKKSLFAILALFSVTGLFAQERTAIAVFPFEDMDNVLTRNESVLFYRRFSNEFVNKNNGSFRVIPRQDVEKLINTEAAFQLSDFSAKAKTAEMNRVLNGAQILSGYIGRLGSKVTISISLFTYPELEQLPGGVDLDVANKDVLFEKVQELVQTMQDKIAGKGTGTDRNTGGNTRGSAGKTYKIGDIGPAGGIVFYDKGVFSGGWRYLEAAPVETEFTAPWSAHEEYVQSISTAVGSGKRNTELIVERLRQLGEDGSAAQVCVSLNFDGYKDWFLPSKDELDLMYKNLKRKRLGGFSNINYWSSSQANVIIYAWYQYFGSGNQIDYRKANTLSVRAVRAF
jgi:TolB-like protein